MTGSKLGNDFKWATIKANIDYEQDRDRILIQVINGRMKSGEFSATSSRDEYSNILGQAYRESKTHFDGSPLSTQMANLISDVVRAEQQPDIDPQIALRLKRRKKRLNR